MSDLSKQVGKRIRQIRETNGIKQYYLAEKLNMEPSNLTRIENGYQFPKEENLLKIAHILKVDVKDLFEFPQETTKDILAQKIISTFDVLNENDMNFIYKFIKLYKNI